MTQDYISLVHDVLLIAAPLLGIWLDRYLQAKKSKEKFILESKKQAYQNFISGVSTDFIFKDEDIHALVSDPHYETKMKVRMGNVLSAARLVCAENILEKLRHFYSVKSKILEMVKNNQDTTNITQEAGILSREIEDDMRKDIK